MRRSIGTVAVLALALTAASVTSVIAAYPGGNGRVAFVRDADIWTVRPDGSGLVRLTSFGADERAGSPAWSPDGRRIAYQACLPYAGVVNCDIWTMRADGSSKTRITTHAATEGEPTWSPDGRWLAFTSNRKLVELIYRLRSTIPYGRAISVTQPPAEDDPYFGEWFGDVSPVWSPLGDLIAFDRTTHSGSAGGFGSDLHVIAWTGGTASQVPGYLEEYWPSWSPRGTRIAFTSRFTYVDECVDIGYGDSANIVHVDPAGTDETQVTHYRGGSYRFARSPAWSPDGRWIVFDRETIVDPCGEMRRRDAIFRVRSGGAAPPVFVIGNGTQPDWQPVPAGS